MKLSDSTKFWLIFGLILLAAFLGGILGNWVFIYLLDKYYGVPGGNYLAGSGTSSSVIIREAKPSVAALDSLFAQTLSSIDRSLVRIFKKQADGLYQPKSAVALGVVMTSDGWIMSLNNLEPDENGSWQNYEVMTYDRKVFTIESIKRDNFSQVNFVHLAEAKNLTVSNFVVSQNLFVGQNLISVGLDGSVELGRLLLDTTTIYSSDRVSASLPVTGFSNRLAYFYNAGGQMVGLGRDGSVLSIDSMERDLEKLLTENKITYARLGVYYLDLNKTLDKNSRTGALIINPDKDTSAVIENSPAAKAGLKVGDIITALDNTPINEFNNLTTLLQDYEPGDSILLAIRRANETLKLSVTLDELTIN